MLKPFCKKLYINIGFKYTSTIKSLLINNKTSVNKTAGVCNIPCQDCDLVYVEETGWDLDIRIKEHKYAVKTCNTNNVVFKHIYDTNHNIDWQNSCLIYKCNDYKKCKVIESICIQKYNSFNLSEGTYKTDPIMRSLVERSLPSALSPRIRGGVRWGASFS